MSNKDALRELQVRLAQRLQAVREQPREAGWLAVECSGAGVLLPLAQAGEIHAERVLTLVPHSADWMVGVANLRGHLHTVVDLACFLGLRGPGPSPMGSQLVVLNMALHVNCALRVDRLMGLRDPSLLVRLPDDAAAPRPAFAGSAWQDQAGRRWQELNLAAMAEDPRFLDVAAA